VGRVGRVLDFAADHVGDLLLLAFAGAAAAGVVVAVWVALS
jgi:phosphatidylglycerophosphate synthase